VHPRSGGLLVDIALDRPLDSARLKVQQVSKNRYHHEIVMRDPADIDYELRAWITAAYELAR